MQAAVLVVQSVLSSRTMQAAVQAVAGSSVGRCRPMQAAVQIDAELCRQQYIQYSVIGLCRQQ
jgi:hypothetical protein